MFFKETEQLQMGKRKKNTSHKGFLQLALKRVTLQRILNT